MHSEIKKDKKKQRENGPLHICFPPAKIIGKITQISRCSQDRLEEACEVVVLAIRVV